VYIQKTKKPTNPNSGKFIFTNRLSWLLDHP
jgi:hypothetical protein